MAAVVIRPDGALVEVLLEAGRVLEGLYGAIGCRWVDVVRLSDSMDMWVDDEGMLVGEVNAPATRLARSCGFVWQRYFGVVVVTGGADLDGNTVSLGVAQLAAIRGLLTEEEPAPALAGVGGVSGVMGPGSGRPVPALDGTGVDDDGGVVGVDGLEDPQGLAAVQRAKWSHLSDGEYEQLLTMGGDPAVWEPTMGELSDAVIGWSVVYPLDGSLAELVFRWEVNARRAAASIPGAVVSSFSTPDASWFRWEDAGQGERGG